MLDILRLHSRSIVIKIILGAIIVSFALFFGFSAARKAKGRGGTDAAAIVNGHAVSAPVFGYFYENQYEQMRQGSKDKELPEFARELAKNYALQRAISRELLYLQAQSFGIVVPDAMLADYIKQSQAAMQGGEFDPVFYKQRFIPHFKNRYNLDYEYFLKEDVEIELLRELFASVDAGAPLENKDSTTKKWSFEVTEIKDGQKDKALASIKAGEKTFTADSKKFAASTKKVGPISISEKDKITGSPLSLEDYIKVFSLKKSAPILSSLVESNGKIYAIRLVDNDAKADAKPADDKESKSYSEPFFQLWMSKLFATAKVENLIDGGKKPAKKLK